MEGRYPAEVPAELGRRGHAVELLAPWDGVVGREMMVQVDPDSGVLQGAADPRHDGYVVGW